MYSWMHSWASSSARSVERRGSTVSSAWSSATPPLKATSPRNPAAIFEGLASILAERREHADEELRVRDRLAHLERGVPGGEQVQVLLVEVGDRLRVVHGELLVGDVVNPCAHDLADQLAAGLAPHGIGDHPDRVLGLDEAQ